MARPFARAIAHFTISNGDLERSSALAFLIWSVVMSKINNVLRVRFVFHPLAPAVATNHLCVHSFFAVDRAARVFPILQSFVRSPVAPERGGRHQFFFNGLKQDGTVL